MTLNTYEVTLVPMYVAISQDQTVPLTEPEKLRVQGTSMDIHVYGMDGEYLVIKNGKEIEYMVPANSIRSCRKLPAPKKRAKVLSVATDKKPEPIGG